ncbi:hypothetical protein [Coleofasciculus chthonoplastes]|jgi:hypothetical protein|uniref:hypothetical protein n=1 Tax=Coleofasciculus chthonoplastes TaxID=64178 RepID=UPI0032F4A2DD
MTKKLLSLLLVLALGASLGACQNETGIDEPPADGGDGIESPTESPAESPTESPTESPE